MSGNTHKVSEGQGQLLKDIGGGDRIREFCTRFYARVFEDKELDKFMFESDGAEMHGKRLADWIIEKMGGEGKNKKSACPCAKRGGGREGNRKRGPSPGPSHARALRCSV